jgi:endogenous inhibitor of DNA gyrase (YacG/DUF329 family)
MAQCKECGSEYEVGVREFCSDECFKINIQKRINEATEKESSHTNKLTKDES